MTQYAQKKYLWISLAFISVACIALFLWLKPQNATTNDQASIAMAEIASGTVVSPNLNETQAQSFSSKSQQDTQINCQIRVDASNNLIVNEQTKDCFEYFITQFGEKNIDQIKNDFSTYAKASYKEPLLSQLTDLWSRYMQYREQLGHLQAPAEANQNNQNDPKYYRAILSSTKTLRKKFFSDYEIEGLFGTQDTYDTYTVDRMEIINDPKLTEQQKAEKLKQLFDQLPEDWKENLQQLNQLEDLRKLTAEIKARHGSAEEIRQMRLNLVGPEATQRLETLDTQRSQWKQRVNQFLSERDGIISSTMSDSAKQSALNQLRNDTFSSPQDRIRIQTFEQIHDQGGTLPFGE